jgi:hypothetical protein
MLPNPEQKSSNLKYIILILITPHSLLLTPHTFGRLSASFSLLTPHTFGRLSASFSLLTHSAGSVQASHTFGRLSASFSLLTSHTFGRLSASFSLLTSYFSHIRQAQCKLLTPHFLLLTIYYLLSAARYFTPIAWFIIPDSILTITLYTPAPNISVFIKRFCSPADLYPL